MPENEWMSPGAAIARQMRVERQILATVERTAREFLRTVQANAISQGLQLSSADVSELWRDSVSRAMMGAEYLSAEAASYVLEGLLSSDIPDEAYMSARAVLVTAAEQQWSFGRLKEQMTLAMDLDSATVTQEAFHEPDMLGAAGFWSGLATAGSRWISKVRTLVRTTSTGLDGWVTMQGLRITGVPYKRWVTRHDDLVRESHAAADGQTVPVEASFMVGGQALGHPGDKMAPAVETVNCRCVIVGVLRGA